MLDVVVSIGLTIVIVVTWLLISWNILQQHVTLIGNIIFLILFGYMLFTEFITALYLKMLDYHLGE